MKTKGSLTNRCRLAPASASIVGLVWASQTVAAPVPALGRHDTSPTLVAQTSALDSRQSASDFTAALATVEEAGEIVVTAQKRSERLRDVPISITAVTGDSLARQGVSTPADLQKVTTGFSYQRSAFGVPVFNIRGIGLYDTNVGTSPTVTVYVDQTPLPFLALTKGAGLDVERVEVLKGPQGTLFGQNNTGGAINYIAAKPTSELHQGFDLSVGRFSVVEAQAFVSGPINDKLKFRVVGRHEYGEGWQISETRPNDRLGSRDFSQGRLLVDWNPSSRFSLELNANGWVDRSETQASQFVLFSPARPLSAGGYPEGQAAVGSRMPTQNNPRIADWDPGVDYRRDDYFYQFSARALWSITDHIALTSISSFLKFREHAPFDTDGTNFNVFTFNNLARVRSMSQEVRADIDVSPLRITVGFNYADDQSNEDKHAFSHGSNTGVGPFRYSQWDQIGNQKVKTYAGFGSAELKMTPKLSVQGGLRYTQQDRNYQGCLADGGDGGLALAFSVLPTLFKLPPARQQPNGSCVTYTDTTTFSQLPNGVTGALNQHNLSWKVGLNWKPSPTALVYTNITKGYKAGVFDPLPAVFAVQLVPVTQESVLAYEVGIKTSVLDRKAKITAAAFYYDYNDKQVLGVTNVFPFGQIPSLENIPKSSVPGGELQISLFPVKGLTLTGGATYVRSRVDRDFISIDPLGKLVNYKGEEFPNTPRWQLISNVVYEFPLSISLTAELGANLSYRSISNSAFGNNRIFEIKPYTLVDIRAGVRTVDGKIDFSIWGRNITNAYYNTNVYYIIDVVARTAGMPVTYGASLRTRF